MRSLVVGMGEVGRAHYDILKRVYPDTHGYDIVGDYKMPSKDEPFDILHIALPYVTMGKAAFVQAVNDYIILTSPKMVNILSTVEPGVTESLGVGACHSTTRGLHPNLQEGLLTITKHIGGPKADTLARYFRKAGLKCVTHVKSRTTEVAHILNNAAYGVSLMFADEMAAVCREYGADYGEAVMLYTLTNNEGFRQLDHASKCRMVLTPPNGRIGGHCVTQSANMLPEEKRGLLMSILATYNLPKDPGMAKAWRDLVAYNPHGMTEMAERVAELESEVEARGLEIKGLKEKLAAAPREAVVEVGGQ